MRIASAAIILLIISWSTLNAQEMSSLAQGRTDIVRTSATPDTTPPPDFVEVEKEPAIVVKKEPAYPEIALRAGIEGKVWVKIWVDTDGRARQAIVLKSDNEIFNQPALEAAKQFVFTPAIKAGKPVSVWVSVPFKFTVWKESDEMRRYAEELQKTITSPAVIIVKGPKNLKKLITYPLRAVQKRIQGTVFASAGLSDSCVVSDVKITQSLGPECDRAVMVALASYDFSTEKDLSDLCENGRVPVVVQFILPSKK